MSSLGVMFPWLSELPPSWCSSYDEIVTKIAALSTGSGVSNVVKYGEERIMSNNLLARVSDILLSLYVDFSFIQVRYLELNIAVPDKASEVFGLELERLD